jgi:hypothetical protein
MFNRKYESVHDVMQSFGFSKNLCMEKQKGQIHIWIDVGLRILMNSASGPIACWICLFYSSSHKFLFNLRLCMNKNQYLLHELIFFIIFFISCFVSYESWKQYGELWIMETMVFLRGWSTSIVVHSPYFWEGSLFLRGWSTCIVVHSPYWLGAKDTNIPLITRRAKDPNIPLITRKTELEGAKDPNISLITRKTECWLVTKQS